MNKIKKKCRTAASTRGESFSAKLSYVTVWRFRGFPMIKHPCTWGSNEVLAAEKISVVSTIFTVKWQNICRPHERDANRTQLTLGHFARKFWVYLVKGVLEFWVECFNTCTQFKSRREKQWKKLPQNIRISFRCRKLLLEKDTRSKNLFFVMLTFDRHACLAVALFTGQWFV